MSRIGKQSITVPTKVKVTLNGQKIVLDGPKGNLSRILPSLVCCTYDEVCGINGQNQAGTHSDFRLAAFTAKSSVLMAHFRRRSEEIKLLYEPMA